MDLSSFGWLGIAQVLTAQEMGEVVLELER